MEKNNWYEAPVVEVIEVEVEKGFANSYIGASLETLVNDEEAGW